MSCISFYSSIILYNLAVGKFDGLIVNSFLVLTDRDDVQYLVSASDVWQTHVTCKANLGSEGKLSCVITDQLI